MKQRVSFIHGIGSFLCMTKYNFTELEMIEKNPSYKPTLKESQGLIEKGAKFSELPDILYVKVIGLGYIVNKKKSFEIANYTCRLVNQDTSINEFSGVTFNVTAKKLFSHFFETKVADIIKEASGKKNVKLTVNKSIQELNRENKPSFNGTIGVPDTYSVPRSSIPVNKFFDVNSLPEVITGKTNRFVIKINYDGSRDITIMPKFDTSEGRRSIAVNQNGKVVTVYDESEKQYEDFLD